MLTERQDLDTSKEKKCRLKDKGVVDVFGPGEKSGCVTAFAYHEVVVSSLDIAKHFHTLCV